MARSRSSSSASASASSSSSSASSSSSLSSGSSASASAAAQTGQQQQKKKKSSAAAPAEARRLRQWKPPAGFSQAAMVLDDEIDLDKLANDDNFELFAVRAPSGFKAKHLDGSTIDLGATETSVKTKKGDFEVSISRSTRQDGLKRQRGQDETGALTGELESMVPLLPATTSTGSIAYRAPAKALAGHITFTRAAPALPNLPSHSTLISSQPSPVPGAVLSAKELRDGVAPSSKKERKPQPGALNLHVPSVSGSGCGIGGQAGGGKRKPVDRATLLASSAHFNPRPKPVPAPRVQEGGESADAEAVRDESESPRKKKQKKEHSEDKKDKKEKKKRKSEAS